ncbi:MAG: hypothetical protein AB1767_06025 [Bacillota bacterium]
MKEILELLITAGVVEAIWEHLKPLWPRCLKLMESEKGKPIDRLGVLLAAVAACGTLQFNMLEAVGLPLADPWLGALITGILVSRLSSLWHDLLGVADGSKRNKKLLEIESGL